jgi:hypothetical protein
MTNLVVFNIYWYLLVSVFVTIWALSDALSKKQGRLGKIWDWSIVLLGSVSWYVSIFTFQKYMLGTLTQERLEDMDSWINVYITLGYLIISLIIYITYTRPNKRLVKFILEGMKEDKKCG